MSREVYGLATGTPQHNNTTSPTSFVETVDVLITQKLPQLHSRKLSRIMASVSHRYSIRWLPDDASEPTSTLVLTLESGFYIDVRLQIRRQDGFPSCLPFPKDPLLTPPSGNTQRALPTQAGNGAPRSSWQVDLDWAFAGTSTSEGSPRKCTWRHWVDSRTSLMSEKPFEDSGIMFLRDDGLTLEKGSMVNPATGKETEYEEIWEDPPLVYPPGLQYEYYVLTFDDVRAEGQEWARGVIVQLGPWSQTVLRRDRHGRGDNLLSEFEATRWKYSSEGRKWELVVGLGQCYVKIPSPGDIALQMASGKVESGDPVVLNGHRWLCREVSWKRKDALR